MRLDVKSAGFLATGAFLLLLIFGIGWPGSGVWLLALGLLTLFVSLIVWWIDSATVPNSVVVPASSGYSPRGAPFRGGNPSRRSRLLYLGLPGPDGSGRWVLPDSVHVALVSGAIGVLALIIFIGDAVGGQGNDAAPLPIAEQPSDARVIDFEKPVVPELAAAVDPAAETADLSRDPIDIQPPTNPQPGLARPIEVVNAPRETPNTVLYEVVAGDTIYDIAGALGSSVDAIIEANEIGEFDIIHVGQILLIPLLDEEEVADASGSPTDPDP